MRVPAGMWQGIGPITWGVTMSGDVEQFSGMLAMMTVSDAAAPIAMSRSHDCEARATFFWFPTTTLTMLVGYVVEATICAYAPLVLMVAPGSRPTPPDVVVLAP